MARFPAVVALLIACGPRSPGSNGVENREITGKVEWYSFEGGFWAILGSDGVTYDPSIPLDSKWLKPDLPVQALVRVRNDLAGIHMAGPIVDVLRIDQLSCAGLPCPSPPAPVMIGVAGNDPVNARTVPVLDGTLSNVQRPPRAGVTPSFTCTTATEPTNFGSTMCSLLGVVPGVYEADVSASGYATKHFRIEVAEHVIKSYECCAINYEPQRIWVDLDPK